LEQTVVVSNKLYFSVSGGTTSATNLTRVSTTEVEPSFTTGLDMYLFARNLNGVAADFAKARVYSVQIYELSDDGTDFVPVRNFTPCEKDGRAALYDSVSGMVFFGQGADLIAPPDLGAVPDAFVDYVESDGTQFIDTGVTARSGTKATAKLIYTESDTTAAADDYGGYVVLGAKGSSNAAYLYMIRRQYNGGNWRWMTCYGGRFQTLFTNMAQDRPYVLASEITTNGTFKATRDGGDVVERDYSGQTDNGAVVGALDADVSFYAFAANLNGRPGHYAKARLYSMTIEQTDENGEYQVVRDFKPCIKDGVAALYDDISKTIFYPTVGKLRAADETAPAKFVEYVESDGTQYVDTCVKGKAGMKAGMTFVANEGNANPSYLLASTANNVYMHFCYFGNGLNVGFGNKAYNTWWGSYSKGTKYSLGVACSQTQEVNAWRSVANGTPEEKTATASGGTDSGMNLFAFARNNAGTADGKCSVKLYSMKIWQADDGGTYSLVRDFRPCVATNGIAALYDKMSGTIFYPQGGLLATGGVERAVVATARWNGGAVMTEADLAVAANWDCYDAVGNVVEGATPTAATTVLVGQGSPLLALPAGIAVQDWAGVTLTNSVTLSAAGDWRPLGLMTLANGVTVDLNGNNLVSGGFTLADGTSAAVANSGAAATLTFAVADGNTATMTGITFASNVTFAKTGPGTLVNSGLSVGDGGGESFTMSDGHCGVNGLLLIGGNGQTGTFEQSGGTLEVNGWYLTMGYKTSASGTYTMTGGRLFVRTHQMIVGQASSGSSSFDLSGTGTATLQQGLVIASSGAGSVNVHDGGRLRTSSITKNGTATLTFDGGILEPLGDVTGLLDGMPLTVGGKGFIVDTAGHNASFGSFTLTDGGELIKVGAGTLTITNSPAWSSVVVSNGTLAVAAETSLTLSSVHVAKGAVLDLGGNTVRCGALSGAGTVVNGTLIVTGTLSVAVGNPLTFTGATLDVSGAQVAVADPESITTRDPVVVATSDLAITGHSRTSVSGRRVQISQDGTTYTLELVRNGGFHLYIR